MPLGPCAYLEGCSHLEEGHQVAEYFINYYHFVYIIYYKHMLLLFMFMRLYYYNYLL